MLKSELIERIAAENPHLYQRDVEIIVNAILGTITALARGDRVELRDFGCSRSRDVGRASGEPTQWCRGPGIREGDPDVQDQPQHAPAAQSEG